MPYYEMLAKYDRAHMHHAYDQWPKIAAESYERNTTTMDIEDINHIVFVGMGGSGALGDFFAALLSGTDKHVSLIKGYNLPKTVDANTLLVCSSVSGDTAETLSVMGKASETPCHKVAFTSGGKLSKYCDRNNIPCHVASFIHSPRASFVSFLYTMLGVLGQDIVSRTQVRHSIAEIVRIHAQIGSQNMTHSNPALELAQWIRGIPIIYYPWGFKAAATRFKNSLQENAKNHAMTEDVLEASHNGLVAWERTAPVCPIMISGPDDNPKTKERWDIFSEYFDENSIQYRIVRAQKGHIISKLVGLIYTLDYTSIYLAVLNQVDPTPVRPINFIKKRTD